MELAAELFSPSIIWLLCRAETPAAPRSSSCRGRRCRIDFWHFSPLPRRGRPPPPLYRCFLLLWAPLSGFSASGLSEAQENRHRRNEMKQGSRATSADELQKPLFVLFRMVSWLKEKKGNDKKHSGGFFFLHFFSSQNSTRCVHSAILQ